MRKIAKGSAPIPDATAILAWREARYRRRMDLRLATQKQARAFVREVGFCLLFPVRNVEIPSLWDAIAGRVVPPTSQHGSYEMGRTWGWKDESLDKHWWYYGKLIRGKATLVDLDFLPHFAALVGVGGESAYLQEYLDGRLSAEAKAVMEALLRCGPLDTISLRKEAHLAAEGSKARFERALLDLQTGLKVLPVGVAEAGAWRYAFIWELVPRWLPDLAERAGAISPEEARAAILDRHLVNVITCPLAAAARLFGWTIDQAQPIAEGLARAGRLRMDVRVEGLPQPQLMTTDIRSAKAV